MTAANARNLHATGAATLHEVSDVQRQAATAVLGVAGHTMAACMATLLRGIQDASAMALMTPPTRPDR